MYAELVGADWKELPDAVRAIHRPGVVRGRVRVLRGTNPIARLVGWALGFPPPGEAVEVELCIEADAGRQRWRRRFGDVAMDSLQSSCDGRMRERYGWVCLDFELAIEDSMLILTQRAAALCAGSARIPLPAWSAPRTSARIGALGGRAQIDVEVRAPILGLLLGYRGEVAAVGRSH